MHARLIEDAQVSVGCPLSSSSASVKSFQFHIHDFASLSAAEGDYIVSPKFTCNGCQWEVWVYPGGNYLAEEGNLSVYLCHFSKEAIATSLHVKLIDKFGQTKAAKTPTKLFNAEERVGYANFITRSVILDESQNVLDDNGTLTMVVCMHEEPTIAFVPKNPIVKTMQRMFNDQNTADVCFEVGTAGESSVSVHAHRLILEMCAPMLAAICGSHDSGGVITASVNDVKPEIFQHLLFYVYGGSVPEEELKTHAKDIIDAADKYSIVNLKLTAEAAYVESTDISLDNAMDNLLYADSMNLALLKEAVMNFLAENELEAAAQISFTDFPGHVVKDLLIAVGKSKKKEAGNDELTTISVSALRRLLDMMGLEVDGSREAMIESIKRKFD